MAPAKINLFLHSGPAKPNGRHELDSLVAFCGTGASDYVSAEASDALTLDVTGPFAREAGSGEGNLVLKAARALRDAAGLKTGAALRLDKQLPVAAGIGGGSADAGAALRALTRLWKLDPMLASKIAPALGGDVPVALTSRPARMRGEGERVDVVALPQAIAILLVNPRVPCATSSVFAAFDQQGGGRGFYSDAAWPDFDSKQGLFAWLLRQRNDLERAAMGLVPDIAEVIDFIRSQRDCHLARMSGSGATCFGLFEDRASSERAAIMVQKEKPNWWAACSVLEDVRPI
jgi:4-diphosphocytidyl-2-C-methyl-D-erythritol kinase